MKRTQHIRLNLKSTFFSLILLVSITFLNGCQKSPQDNKGDQDGGPDITSNWKAGDEFSDTNDWTACKVGTMPLIISVPHGGQLKPDDFPDRTCDATTVTDLYTIELANQISESFQQKYGIRPYLVICNLKRTKIDQNRDLPEATCGNTDLTDTWELFHNYIDTALADAVTKYGSALYIDLHGHGHANQRLELGYSLSHDELRDVYLNTGLASLWHESTLNNLKVIKTEQDFRKYMIGDQAFGSMMQNKGFNAVPAKLDPYPKSTDSYFNGGFNTRRYTSASYPKVFGFQIESNYDGVRDKAGRPLFADAFTTVIMDYLHNTIAYKP